MNDIEIITTILWIISAAILIIGFCLVIHSWDISNVHTRCNMLQDRLDRLEGRPNATPFFSSDPRHETGDYYGR